MQKPKPKPVPAFLIATLDCFLYIISHFTQYFTHYELAN